MMELNTKKLLSELYAMVNSHIEEINLLLTLSDDDLQYKKSEKSWSVIECIEHLNRYGEFYIPEIKNRIEKSTHQKSEICKSGVLGNYFAKSMLPKKKLNKMKTFKDKNPIGSKLNKLSSALSTATPANISISVA